MTDNFMFLLGFFSLCQIIFIPGIILLKLFKIKTTGLIQLLLYSFGLSLYCNYLIVCILTWLKLYTAPVIYLLFSIEVIYIVYLLIGYFYINHSGKTVKDYYLLLKEYLTPFSLRYKIVFALSFVTILFFLSLIPFSTGTSYYFIDAVNHWTRWPVQWASNIFPPGTRHYPQLFPANLSLIYVFTGEPGFQFFPKAVMPFFFIGILLIYFDISVYRKSIIDLTSLIIYGFLLLIFYSVLFILELNADIPVSFFSFLTFYAIIRNDQEGFNVETILLIVVFASSAALTKLAGLYILTLAGLWIIYVYYKNRKSISISTITRTIVYILLLLFGSIFWYLVRPADMLQGLDQSIYLAPDYYTRFLSAVKMLFFTLGLPFFLFLLITIIASLFSKQSRYIVILIVIPVLILWAFFFSADFRNLSLAVPFIAYTSGYGVWVIYNKIFRFRKVTDVPISSEFFFKNKTLISWFVALSLLAAYSAFGTAIFFNFGIKFAYVFHNIFSGNYRLNYFSEIGYYRYFEYIVDALRLLCIVLFVLFIIKKARLKISHILLFLFTIIMIAGFTIL
ncbi:MAG: hypothetical protein P4L27_07860, partial [Ignavibacteriaceae bacterium]|nr:hypothetical protein [Ignavibacteriaceae bacterium]